MRQSLRKVMHVLDGQPVSLRGQSLVEMAITFPILILMVLSLVEVGFLANNYLILIDAVRAAGRAAVNLDPSAWKDADTRNQNRMDCDIPEGGPTPNNHSDTYYMFGNVPSPNDQRSNSNGGPRGQHLPGYSIGNEGPFGFFDEVACQVIRGMTPLLLNDGDTTQSKDDVVVSAISYKVVDYNSPPAQPGNTSNPKYDAGPAMYGNTWVTVTGRWPLANRYCGTYAGNAATTGDERDPFDWMRADFHNGWTNAGDDGDEGRPGDPPAGPSAFLRQQNSDSQGVRGFVFTGNALNDDGSGCYGSKFTVQDIERHMNLSDSAFNREVPNGGLVIVEVFWQHHPLFLGPLFQGFTGNRFNDPVLWIWGWFPVPSTEPTETPAS
jgi:TadE-like protein